MPSATLTRSRALTGRDRVLSWVTFTKADGTRVAWSGVAISDPSTYEDGRKEARLLLIQDLVVALSDRSGRIQATRATFQLSDLPDPFTGQRLLGGWLESGETFRNVEIEVKLISDAERRLGYTPIVVFRGLVEQDGGEGFALQVQCIGAISPMLDEDVVQTTVGERWPAAPEASRARRLPVALGRLSDELAPEDPPVLSNEPARAVTSSLEGFGDLPGATPTNVTLTENAGAGDIDAGVKIRAHVSFDHAATGLSNPTPFLFRDLEIVTTAPNAAVTVAFDNPDGLRARVDIQVVYGSFELDSQHIVTTGTSVQCTKVHPLGQDPLPSTITPGWTPTYNAGTFFDAISAVVNGVETELSTESVTSISPFPRPRRITWTPVVGATGYYRYRRGTTGTYYKRIFVEADSLNSLGDVFDDALDTDARWTSVAGGPQAKGVVYPFPIAQKVDTNGALWTLFAIAAHACDVTTSPIHLFTTEAGVTTRVSSYGFDYAAPGQTDWTTLFGEDFVLDVDGKRWTVVAVKNTNGDLAGILDGSIVLTANVLGAEDVGDGTGTVVDDLYEQLALVADNLGLLDDSVLGEDWRTSIPTFSDGSPKRDAASWSLAATNSTAVLPGGVKGARWLTEPITWGEFLAEGLRSGYALAGINPAGALQLVVTNRAQSPAASVTGTLDILRDSFSWRDDDAGFGNVQPYQFNPEYSTSAGQSLASSGEISDSDSIARNRQRRKASTLSLDWVRSASQAAAVAALVLADGADLPRTVQLDSGIHGVHWGLGDVLSVTTPEGPGLTGWSDRWVQILGLRISLGSLLVSVTCVDAPIQTQIEVADEVVTFSASDQVVELNATLTPALNVGTVEFTLIDETGATVGTPVAVPVVAGAAVANYTLPGGTGA